MTEKEIKTLSDNTRISLTHINEQDLLEQVNEMLIFIKKIDTLPLKDLPFFEHPLVNQVNLREDIVVDSMDKNLILKNAPQVENSSIVVPKVI